MAYDPGMGNRIRQLRNLKQWTQVDLAEAAGVGQSTIARCESGKQNYTEKTLSKIAHALGVQTIDLYDESVSAKAKVIAARWAALSAPQQSAVVALLEALEVAQSQGDE